MFINHPVTDLQEFLQRQPIHLFIPAYINRNGPVFHFLVPEHENIRILEILKFLDFDFHVDIIIIRFRSQSVLPAELRDLPGVFIVLSPECFEYLF